MTRNQKIALGCGGAGCLGLIVLCIAGLALYLFLQTNRASNRNSNYNFNRSSNSNYSTNNNSSTNDNTNDNASASNVNDNESSKSSSSMSDDGKHRLFHAASVTGDANLINRVGVKIGILKSDFSPTDENVTFLAEHVRWAMRDTDFIQSLNTPEKARAYVEKHLDD